MARPLAYAFDEEHELSSVDPAPHYVLQIWRGGKLVAVEPMKVSYFAIDPGLTYNSHPNNYFGAIAKDIGVEIFPEQSFGLCVVAIPHLETHDFESTLVYSTVFTAVEVTGRIQDLQERCQTLPLDITFTAMHPPRYPDRCDQRKELRGRHIIVYNEVAVGLFRASENEYYAHRCAPRCVARMIRDGREMTALHFDEFKWAFQSLYQQYIKLNRHR